ncbi:nuclear transport factor 2 family protein [Streptomyces sp. NBC_01167]|uniref:nuclear transport factor 2 family protein n=1 Tax=Streptomyces sp. NBC_01167 TaxID=2903756 RepID=UPI00386FC5DE|nr:nuclear transport factor 2 family protein [Streptomyces sp. NBC_01167]
MLRNKEVVRELYSAFNAGDMEKFRSLITTDCEFHEADGHPVPGRWCGFDEIAKATAQIAARLGVLDVSVDELVADGPSRVVGLVRLNGVAANGERYSMAVAECFLIRNGSVSEIRPYYWDMVQLHEIARP